MRRLKQDLFTRGAGPALLRRRPGATTIALMIASIGLLVLSRVEHSGLAWLRWQAAQHAAPLLSSIAVAVEPLRWAGRQLAERRDALAESERLRDENQRLAGWEWRAKDLERRLADLSRLAKVVEQSQIPFATGRVVADSSGPFARAVLIDAGREHHLRNANPVISAEGLVGRIVETGARAARVLLLTDTTSRIPVLLGERGDHAVLAGDNSASPRILFTSPDARIALGEEVATSGVGGLFPRGLRIGRIVADGAGGYRVALHARFDALDYVSVLLTDPASIDVSDESRSPPVDVRTRRAQVRGEGAR
jgi:rod shape-determining protein MreC